MSLTSRVSVALSALLTGTHDFASPSSQLTKAWDLSMTSGTTAGKADQVWSDQRTLSASASEDLDLTGSLTDALGASVTLARVKALIIRASASNTNSVVVGGATSNAWATLLNSTGTITLRPGGLLVAMAGAADSTCWAVTASTGDLLKVANSGAGSSVTYDIFAIGASA